MQNNENKHPINEVGFSYEEMLALENAPFQKEERSIFLEPLEPDLVTYSEYNERGLLKKWREKRKAKKEARRNKADKMPEKPVIQNENSSDISAKKQANINDITSDIETIASEIVEDITKTNASNTRINAVIVEPKVIKPSVVVENIVVPKVVKPSVVVENIVVPKVVKPLVVEKQETKSNIDELKTTLGNVIASEVEKIKIVIENVVTTPIENDKPPIIAIGENIIKPLSNRLLNIKDIIQERLQDGLYYREEYEKNQIYLHHTVSNGNPLSAINWWRQNSVRVATAIVVAGRPHNSKSKYADGEIYQCFWSKNWAHHLGLKSRHLLPDSPSNTYLNKHSLGIEIANWGWLTLGNDGRFTALEGRVKVPENQVVEYSNLYKGKQYYHKYSEAQLESLRKLLVYFCDLFDIPTAYQTGMFDILPAALRGEKGIFTHTSVRPDKSDCHPQAELIEMLRSL